MGGECLNTGCVPSKSMIAAGKRAEAFRTSAPFGIKPVSPNAAFDEVNDHIHRVINAIAPNDFEGAFHRLGRARDRGRSPLS